MEVRDHSPLHSMGLGLPFIPTPIPPRPSPTSTPPSSSFLANLPTPPSQIIPIPCTVKSFPTSSIRGSVVELGSRKDKKVNDGTFMHGEFSHHQDRTRRTEEGGDDTDLKVDGARLSVNVGQGRKVSMSLIATAGEPISPLIQSSLENGIVPAKKSLAPSVRTPKGLDQLQQHRQPYSHPHQHQRPSPPLIIPTAIATATGDMGSGFDAHDNEYDSTSSVQCQDGLRTRFSVSQQPRSSFRSVNSPHQPHSSLSITYDGQMDLYQPFTITTDGRNISPDLQKRRTGTGRMGRSTRTTTAHDKDLQGKENGRMMDLDLALNTTTSEAGIPGFVDYEYGTTHKKRKRDSDDGEGLEGREGKYVYEGVNDREIRDEGGLGAIEATTLEKKNKACSLSFLISPSIESSSKSTHTSLKLPRSSGTSFSRSLSKSDCPSTSSSLTCSNGSSHHHLPSNAPTTTASDLKFEILSNTEIESTNVIKPTTDYSSYLAFIGSLPPEKRLPDLEGPLRKAIERELLRRETRSGERSDWLVEVGLGGRDGLGMVGEGQEGMGSKEGDQIPRCGNGFAREARINQEKEFLTRMGWRCFVGPDGERIWRGRDRNEKKRPTNGLTSRHREARRDPTETTGRGGRGSISLHMDAIEEDTEGEDTRGSTTSTLIDHNLETYYPTGDSQMCSTSRPPSHFLPGQPNGHYIDHQGGSDHIKRRSQYRILPSKASHRDREEFNPALTRIVKKRRLVQGKVVVVYEEAGSISGIMNRKIKREGRKKRCQDYTSSEGEGST